MIARQLSGDPFSLDIGEPSSLLLLLHNRFSKGNLWSCSQYSSNNAWNVNNNGNVNNNNKYNGLTVVPLAELNKGVEAKGRFRVPLSHLLDAYAMCVKNKRTTFNAQKFYVDLEHKIMQLWRDLNDGAYDIGKSICFIVNKPVKREVFAADFRDRIVHDYICARLNPLFEAYLPPNMCSNRLGKGTLYAIQNVAHDIWRVSRGYTRDCWIYKFDLKGFFMSINKPLLNRKIQAFIDERYKGRDIEVLKWLTAKVILNCPQKKCVMRSPREAWDGLRADKSLFTQDGDHGMPIGNLPSQLLANFLLSGVIRFLADNGFPAVTQYVDDFVLVHPSKGEITAFIPRLRAFLMDEYGIMLHDEKTYIQHYRKGVAFVGGIIKPWRIYVSARTRRKMMAKMAWICRPDNGLTPKDVLASVNSYFGLTRHFSAFKLRLAAAQMLFSRFGKAIQFNEHYNKMIIVKSYV